MFSACYSSQYSHMPTHTVTSQIPSSNCTKSSMYRWWSTSNSHIWVDFNQYWVSHGIQVHWARFSNPVHANLSRATRWRKHTVPAVGMVGDLWSCTNGFIPGDAYWVKRTIPAVRTLGDLWPCTNHHVTYQPSTNMRIAEYQATSSIIPIKLILNRMNNVSNGIYNSSFHRRSNEL